MLAACFLFSCSPVENSPVVNFPVDSTDSFQKLSVLNDRIKAEPNNAELYFQRALLNFQNRDTESSLNDVNRSLSIDSVNTDYYLLLADIHFIKKEGIKAKEILNKIIELDPGNTEAFLKLAEIYFLVEQYDISMEYINKAIKIDMHNAKAYFMKGMNFKYSGDSTRAISSMQTAVEQNNDYYDPFIQLGLLYGAKHDSIAVHYYDNALRIKPQSVEALYGKSLFLQEHAQPENALEGYQQILEIDQDNFIAYFNIGFVNLVYLNKLPEALEGFTKAIGLNPKYFEAYCNRGIVYEQMKDYHNAEADFRKALSIRPDYAPAAKGISRVVDKDFE